MKKLLWLAALLGLLWGCARATPVQNSPPPQPAQAQKQAATNKDCNSCHEMLPEVLTWQISSHSKLACTTCHQVNPDDYRYKHQTQDFFRPIKLKKPIPNSVCEQCHSTNRVISASGDLRIPHNRHLQAGLACIKCHNGVVHARIAERGLTVTDNWTLETARKAATDFYTLPNMWDCIDCHKRLNLTRRCGACHTTIPTLPSHDRPDWKAVHGKTARSQIKICANCHALPDRPQTRQPSSGDPAIDFARVQPFCYKCHLQRPAMHGNSMLPIHPTRVQERGEQNCLTCHERTQPRPGEQVPAVYCNQCHW